jgi:hypothetical protein
MKSISARRFFLILVFLAGTGSSLRAQDYGQFQMLLELNYVSAERTIELYQGLGGRPGDIAQLKGSQLALATTELLVQRRLTNADLESALESAKFNQGLGEDLFRMKEARDNAAALKELYDELRKRNFGQRVVSTVEQLFPAGVRVSTTLPIYFVVFGHQNIDAFVRRVVWQGNTPTFTGEGSGELTIVVNLASAIRYGRTVDERYLGLLSTVAHEVFHAAFGAYKDKSPEWRAQYARGQTYLDALMDLTQNEGIAYYLSLIQIARGRLPADWQQRVTQVFATYNQCASELVSPGLTPRRGNEILRLANTSGYWESYGAMTGMIMARAIDQYLGRSGLSETIVRGPADFFLKYAELTRRDPALPALSPSILRSISPSR